MTFLSRKTGQFSYFSRQVGESTWSGKNVLDFGGNVGNILRDPASTIDPDRYWCVDVARESVDKGKARWPQSHWIFYDRQCFFFNPRGVPGLPLPDLGATFHYIVAYSVFTNTLRTDMLDLAGRLEALLAPRGTLAFTFIDPHHRSWPGQYDGDNFQWRLARERGEITSRESQAMIERVRDAGWCTLVNGCDLLVESEDIRPYPPEQQRTCHVFYSQSTMRRLFPHAAIQPPVNGEMQHCCVIRKSRG